MVRPHAPQSTRSSTSRPKTSCTKERYPHSSSRKRPARGRVVLVSFLAGSALLLLFVVVAAPRDPGTPLGGRAALCSALKMACNASDASAISSVAKSDPVSVDANAASASRSAVGATAGAGAARASPTRGASFGASTGAAGRGASAGDLAGGPAGGPAEEPAGDSRPPASSSPAGDSRPPRRRRRREIRAPPRRRRLRAHGELLRPRVRVRRVPFFSRLRPRLVSASSSPVRLVHRSEDVAQRRRHRCVRGRRRRRRRRRVHRGAKRGEVPQTLHDDVQEAVVLALEVTETRRARARRLRRRKRLGPRARIDPTRLRRDVSAARRRRRLPLAPRLAHGRLQRGVELVDGEPVVVHGRRGNRRRRRRRRERGPRGEARVRAGDAGEERIRPRRRRRRRRGFLRRIRDGGGLLLLLRPRGVVDPIPVRSLRLRRLLLRAQKPRLRLRLILRRLRPPPPRLVRGGLDRRDARRLPGPRRVRRVARPPAPAADHGRRTRRRGRGRRGRPRPSPGAGGGGRGRPRGRTPPGRPRTSSPGGGGWWWPTAPPGAGPGGG